MSTVLKYATAFCLVVSAVVLIGCQREPGPDAPKEQPEAQRESGSLSVEFRDDGTWVCRTHGRLLRFFDDDNNGLAESCGIYEGEEHVATVWFHHREYFSAQQSKGLLQNDIERLIANVSADNVIGMNLLIPPVRPLSDEPTRSKRVTDPEAVGSLCSVLRQWSYSWRGERRRTGRSRDGNEEGWGESGGEGMPLRDRNPAWAGIEVWIRGESEPLTITVHHLDNSYAFHEEGLTARWRGKGVRFANDYISCLLEARLAPRHPEEEVVNALDSGEWVSWPARYQATYLGGIRVGPDGQPWHKVTREEKIRQTRALIEAHKFSLLGIPATQATDAAEAAK